jgi:hypothetical protein
MSAFGTTRTSQDVRYLAAFGGKPDIQRAALKGREITHRSHHANQVACWLLRAGLGQGVDDHRPGRRRGWPSKKGHKILLDPRKRASV